MRVRLIQTGVDGREPVADRVARVTRLVGAQHGADLVVLPELWAAGPFGYPTFAALAQPLDGPLVAGLAAAARSAGATVHGGSFVERAGDGRLFNTSVVLGPDGALLASYRKIHLFGFGDGETSVLSAGEDLVVVPVGDLAVGLATCYDLRFPEMFRALLDRGATALVLASGWPAARIEHWRLLLRARAVEDQVLVLACNTVGGEADGVPLGGCSAAVDPWGTVLAEAGGGEEVLDVEVDPDIVARTRAAFPVLADRRLAVAR